MNRRSLGPVLLALLVVVAVGIGIAVARGGDDGGGGGAGGTAGDAGVFGPVQVEGGALARLEDPVDDPAAGRVAPVLEGRTPGGAAVTLGGPGVPTLVVFLAHWCPHCQAEVPLLVELAEDGRLGGVRLVAVLTGTNRDAPNFPPAPWLEREGWPGEAVLDDEDFTAARAYGLSGYPFLVALDAGGNVVARTSGEQPADVVTAMVEAATTPAGP